MWKIQQTTQFKKDFKRYRNRLDMLAELDAVVSALSATGTVPQSFNPHPLKGNWSGYMECHIKGDFLLIWFDRCQGVIKLTRLGTHSELFNK